LAVGLIGWVTECNTLYDVIYKVRVKAGRGIDIEFKNLQKFDNFESLQIVEKKRAFITALSESKADEIKQILLSRANDSNHWIERRTNYSASLAVTSMAGYILGLGDRHLNNIMMKQRTAKLVHIDFGDCFEVAIHRSDYPETVPFRLTRMLQNALEVAKLEGTFRICCENVMRLMRENGEQIIGLLEVFIYDPLLQWITTENTQSEQIVKRMRDKLSGCDFDKKKSVQGQVKKLINDAASIENLCNMFKGWLPWW
jgi:FKBP12-rapamycin complex-associated protein